VYSHRYCPLFYNIKDKLKLECSSIVYLQNLVTIDKNSFEAFVNNKSNLVMINFFAPWCGYCKSLASVLDEVANKIYKMKIKVFSKL
jgi:thiol-disulfide isomerase/thioredoxin